MRRSTIAQAVQAGRAIAVNKKYTVQSSGIWELIRRIFAVDSRRSNGVPLNPQFRNPPPGVPTSFVDPVTLPAGDIAANAYWQRDSRRAYPQLSFVTQTDAAGLLSSCSGGGDAVVTGADSGVGLATFFSKAGCENALKAFGKDGLPPLPGGVSNGAAVQYSLTDENAYPSQYPCRTFK